MSGSNELPSVSTPAKGCALVREVETDDARVLDFIVQHTVKNPISLEVRRGREGVAGPTKVSFE